MDRNTIPDGDGDRDRARGRAADDPTEIPKRGWWDILWRVKREADEDAVAFYAAGVSFYFLLALVPTLAAVAGIYGIVVDRATVVDHVALLGGIVPAQILSLIEEELITLTSSESSAGLALVTGLGLALWGSSKAVDALTIALNRVYDEEETRGFIRRKLNALALTAGIVMLVAVLLMLLVVAPMATRFAGFGESTDWLISIARWPLLFLISLVTVTVVYRFAPCRNQPKWRWVAPGSLFAAGAWLAISFGLTLYATHFGGGSSTYGSIGAVLALMSFFYLTAAAFLFGGELNAETEHQTARDSTVGHPKPMGERGAYVADTLGEARSGKQ